jgi:NAD(P)-dependent dehydrogenase (short-subunit alcohol dehydrogenase family)
MAATGAALVTGASYGVGAATVLALARAGYDVAVTATKIENLAATVKALEDCGARHPRQRRRPWPPRHAVAVARRQDLHGRHAQAHPAASARDCEGSRRGSRLLGKLRCGLDHRPGAGARRRADRGIAAFSAPRRRGLRDAALLKSQGRHHVGRQAVQPRPCDRIRCAWPYRIPRPGWCHRCCSFKRIPGKNLLRKYSTLPNRRAPHSKR